MNETQAKSSLASGKKLTHPAFAQTEWIEQVGNRLIDEKGESFPLDYFWSKFIMHDVWKTDWMIFEEQTVNLS